MNILEEAGFRLNKEKCKWFQREVEYLGFRVNEEGIHPTTEKIQAIVNVPAPKNVTELQAYLGLLNFYRKFIPNASTILGPLTQLLKKGVAWK